MFDVARRKFIKKTSVKYSFNNKELRLSIIKAVKRIGNNITIYYLNADIIKINLEKSITRTTSKFMLLLNFRKRQTALMNKQSEFTSPKAGLILTIIAIC